MKYILIENYLVIMFITAIIFCLILKIIFSQKLYKVFIYSFVGILLFLYFFDLYITYKFDSFDLDKNYIFTENETIGDFKLYSDVWYGLASGFRLIFLSIFYNLNIFIFFLFIYFPIFFFKKLFKKFNKN